jgi:DNA mismatch repair protein MutS
MTMMDDYFKYTKELSRDYGEKNTIVLMQVGAFYEAYGLKNPLTGAIEGSNIKDYTEKCELALSQKNSCVNEKNVMMAGFGLIQLDKYLKKLQNFGYTVAVYSQDEKAAGTTRSLTGIFSPGTFFTSDSPSLTNNTMCLWMEKIGKLIAIGISNIDIYTGRSFLFEYQQEFTSTPEAYDELEKYISIYKPSELIVIHNLAPSLVENILHYIDLQTQSKHILDINDKANPHLTKISNCEKQVFQLEIMKKFFGNDNANSNSNDICFADSSSLFEYPIGTQSYCYLLDFIFQHNPDLTRKIQLPVFENRSTRMNLANHSLKQLNIIDSGLSGSRGVGSSVLSLLNRCKTPMGKRKFEYTLLHPLTEPKLLQHDYNYCEHLLCKGNEHVEYLRNFMADMKDFEKLARKTALKRITPSECAHMYNSLEIVEKVYNEIHLDSISADYIFAVAKREVNQYAQQLRALIKSVLVLERAFTLNTLLFDSNFIQPGFNKEHDILVETWYDSYDILVGIQKYFNSLVAKFEKGGKQSKSDYVKIHSTEKMGNSIICTKRRSTILKNELNKVPMSNAKNDGVVDVPYYSRYSNSTKTIQLNIKDITYESASASNVSIVSPEISRILKQILTSKNIMVASLDSIYQQFVKSLFEKLGDIEEIVKFVALVDFSYAKAHISFKFNLCKPSIQERESSFVNVKGMRHILIESLLKDELYVTNDIALDEKQLGVLLYGTNAVGKSSFIKALGISVIMAQAGFYVPCSEFLFFPYKNIFTRILGNDNLFKGLSSFAVEMIELKTILSMADHNSLILGDELCSGTESNSAISIFLAGIQHLYEKESSFIFATHFHEMVDYEEVRAMTNLSLKHMAVSYDKTKDKLVYDRKLHDGPGQSMYGLEVCKSLHLPSEFLEQAHAIRNKYNAKTGSILEWKQSRYNSNKLRGICEECQEEFSTEVHHIAHQKDAQENGYIGSFHKNHLANLKALCEKCHMKEHQNEKITHSQANM